MFLRPLLRDPQAAWALESGSGSLVARRLEAAFDSASRRRGLLGRDTWTDAALVIAPCEAHMFFMRFPIDVVFVSRDGRVLKVRANVVPRRMTASLGAFAAIEFAANSVSRVGLAVGWRLAIR